VGRRETWGGSRGGGENGDRNGNGVGERTQGGGSGSRDRGRGGGGGTVERGGEDVRGEEEEEVVLQRSMRSLAGVLQCVAVRCIVL